MNPETAKQINRLFDRWRSRYAACSGHFIRDGVVGSDESCWSDAKTKVLFLLKDCNDPEDKLSECGHDLCELLRLPEIHTWPNMAFAYTIGRWAYGIQHSTLNEAAPFDDADDRANRKKALHCSAVVNLKKIAGCAQSKPKDLEQSVKADGDLLREQLGILNPQVVICGGTAKFVNILIPDLNLRPYSFKRLGGRIWLSCVHPSIPGKNAKKLYKTAVSLYQQALQSNAT